MNVGNVTEDWLLGVLAINQGLVAPSEARGEGYVLPIAQRFIEDARAGRVQVKPYGENYFAQAAAAHFGLPGVDPAQAVIGYAAFSGISPAWQPYDFNAALDAVKSRLVAPAPDWSSVGQSPPEQLGVGQLPQTVGQLPQTVGQLSQTASTVLPWVAGAAGVGLLAWWLS